MPLFLSSKRTINVAQDRATLAQHLVLSKSTTLMPSLADMTKNLLAKAFPSSHRKAWDTQNSPTGVDGSTSEQDGEVARGEVREIFVVAIQRVTDVNDHATEVQGSLRSSQLEKTSMWGSKKWSLGHVHHLPDRIACTVRSGATTKDSTQPERSDNEFVFDEKFVFERRENDAQYHEVTIEVSSVAPGFAKKHRLGYVTVDLDAAFAAQSTGLIYRNSTLTKTDGSKSSVKIHYVLHRLEVKNATAAAASRVLTRSSRSLNDDDDMDACGQIFPDLWYLC
ncbi:hypothetical protein PsorP6_005694 [Peronosclerospora sorghi]|uniref:Uncharacterized protein n=1 Tax=Peronosclerospora sorghi TaxID=230839 RepID=A0ACC0W5K1_9STRA|nr:hypothetical protein PsorP6_005694 [Peronosclerospora sorghi]